MKKLLYSFILLHFFLTVFYIFGLILLRLFGYIIEITNIPFFTCIIMTTSIILVILTIFRKGSPVCVTMQILLAIAMPISVVNGVCMVTETSDVFVAVCCCISSLCGCWITHRLLPSLSIKSILYALFLFLAYPAIFLSLFALLFGGIRKVTVVQRITSPSGNYYAEVIDDDQGALGGSTIVAVSENKDVSVFLFKISKEPQTIYYGEWGEFMEMEVSWYDETSVMINGLLYEIE